MLAAQAPLPERDGGDLRDRLRRARHARRGRAPRLPADAARGSSRGCSGRCARPTSCCSTRRPPRDGQGVARDRGQHPAGRDRERPRARRPRDRPAEPARCPTRSATPSWTVEHIDLAIEGGEPLTSPSPAAGPSTPSERSPSRSPGWSPTARRCSSASARFRTRRCARSRARRGLRVWSEMISDGVMGLERAGALARERRSSARSCSARRSSTSGSTATPASGWRAPRRRTTPRGSPRGRRWSRSTRRCRSTSTTRPARATSGGASTRGSAASRTSSRARCAPTAARRSSRCAPGTSAATARRSFRGSTTPVTSFQHSAVVTEQGCAHLFGRSQRAQARLLIENAAHPGAREWLSERHAAGRPLPGAAVTA